LEERFNSFFQNNGSVKFQNYSPEIAANLPKLASHIDLKQNNFFVALPEYQFRFAIISI